MNQILNNYTKLKNNDKKIIDRYCLNNRKNKFNPKYTLIESLPKNIKKENLIDMKIKYKFECTDLDSLLLLRKEVTADQLYINTEKYINWNYDKSFFDIAFIIIDNSNNYFLPNKLPVYKDSLKSNFVYLKDNTTNCYISLKLI